MSPHPPSWPLSKKLALVAGLGVLGLLLAGPVLAALALLVPFVLICGCLYLGARLCGWPTPAWRERCGRAREWGEQGFTCARRLGAGAWGRVRGWTELVRDKASFVGALLLETVSGALVGLFLVLLGSPGHTPPGQTLAAATLLGGFVGALCVLARRPRRERLEQAPEGLN